MTSHLEHFGLQEKPFEIVTDPRFYYASREHKEAMARLAYLVDQQSMYFGMLTGEIGSGKSITRKVFASNIDWQKHYVVELENSGFSFEELMAQLLVKSGQSQRDLGGTPSSARIFGLLTSLATELQRQQGRQLVIILDEAQDLSEENLLQFKRLSNLNGEIDGSITVILIGQPELRDQVAALPPLDQRISLRFHLPNLAHDETASYLHHRLRVAGRPGPSLFASAAVDLLHRTTRGVPRELNRLAKLSLEAAAANRSEEIGPEQVQAVVEDLRRHQSLPGAFSSRT